METKKILVVDDQPGNVFLLQDRLNREGYKVITAYEGEVAVKKAIDEQPDLILLDVMMPGLDGFETCKEIATIPETQNIPVIMLTALNSAEDMQKGFDSGAFDFIRKPFNKIELLARVRAAVRFASMNKILLNLEKINTFSATVKKTNHEIKQPLTLINLSVTALKRELTATDFKKDAALKRVEFIENAAIEIIKIMQTMLSIDKIELNDYIESLKNYEFKLDVEAEEILE